MQTIPLNFRHAWHGTWHIPFIPAPRRQTDLWGFKDSLGYIVRPLSQTKQNKQKETNQVLVIGVKPIKFRKWSFGTTFSLTNAEQSGQLHTLNSIITKYRQHLGKKHFLLSKAETPHVIQILYKQTNKQTRMATWLFHAT